MKIAVDATPVAHGSRAIRRNTKNLIEALLRQGVNNEYKLLYIDRYRQYQRYIKIHDNLHVKQFVIPLPHCTLTPLWQYFSLPKAEWMLNAFDVFYASDLYFPPSSKGLVLGSVRGIAYHVIEEKLNPKEVFSLKKGLRYTLKYADYLLAVSNSTRDDLIERLNVPAERIYVVSHGIDPSFYKIQDREALSKRLKQKLGFSPPYILFVGVIGHHKNIMGILNAYLRLKNNKTDIPLILAGPPGSAWIEANKFIAEHNLSKYVYLTGLIDQDGSELTDLYNGADLFIFPSFYEGWTTPPLEAMSCGTPVITSNCSSLPETVGEGAIRVDPDDIERMAGEMERVIYDTSLQSELIAKGFKHVAEHTWDRTAINLINVFNDIHIKGAWKG